MTGSLVHEDADELAWAAGFFDADGCFSSVVATRYPVVSIGQVDHQPLARLMGAVGAGSISGPYASEGPGRLSKRPQHFYHAYGAAAVRTGAAKLWPSLGMTKRVKALAVLEAAGHTHGLSVLTPIEGEPLQRRGAAWAAGFMDGEGCFTHNPSSHSSCVAITNTEVELLERFRSIVSVGMIYGPYLNRNGISRKPHYLYRATGHQQVQSIVAMLWFRLGSAKRAQAASVLARRRRVCHNGHSKVAGHKACAQCTADYWRRKRGGASSEWRGGRMRGSRKERPPSARDRLPISGDLRDHDPDAGREGSSWL
ncbi:MAG: hypothetical protein HY775_05420 [Acidobacteria bacterium]|nr:hypothetical protein [Acidobacteriota bacterium]